MKSVFSVIFASFLLSGCALFNTVGLLHPDAADAISKAEKNVTAETAEAIEQICNRVDQADIDHFVAEVNDAADDGDVFNGITCL